MFACWKFWCSLNMTSLECCCACVGICCQLSCFAPHPTRVKNYSKIDSYCFKN
ncbi:unnamed protein product, partial [Larinioides sclopetarius]